MKYITNPTNYTFRYEGTILPSDVKGLPYKSPNKYELTIEEALLKNKEELYFDLIYPIFIDWYYLGDGNTLFTIDEEKALTPEDFTFGKKLTFIDNKMRLQVIFKGVIFTVVLHQENIFQNL